ncbi:cortical protein marker for cell polarity-domain-containing protein [Syncephalastrum racemosum]|uniref:Cortical protein marker for cell polarity-domain-containing protein n=1 Tax=Syncephalastrum racemosum TaxID=13706 RepID=A0A1X2H5P6_SYNRA|nr:cortical protein marker for cell polarity-domain-containing protein [Syncephalastrum racemosum]
MTSAPNIAYPGLLLLLLLISACLPNLIAAQQQQQQQNYQNNQHLLPTIRYDDIGHLGFAGNYAGISAYVDTRQFESLDPTLSSLVLETNNTFGLVASADAPILASCATLGNLVVGGSFTALNNTPFNHIALYNSSSGTLQSLGQGLDGAVQSLLCTDDILYVGGDFTAPVGTSNNTAFGGHVAAYYFANMSWSPLPWQGLNGPVYTITRHPSNGNVFFGGRFDATSDGHYFNPNSSQPVSMNSPTQVSSGNGALSGNGTDPNSIACGVNQSNPWYLQDGVPGYWEATFGYPVQPSLFRISNLHSQNKGAKTFSIIALGSNEYFELSYVDPTTHQTVICSEACTLSNDTNLQWQDFTVLNSLKTSGVRINIDDWYGSGGGLSGVQIFQSDIGVHPHLNSGNSQCGSNATTTGSTTNITGDWEEKYVYGTYQNFLTATFPSSDLATSNASVTYSPYIPAQGQYTVYATTPGCVGSSTCNQRTQVELLMQFTPGIVTTQILDQAITEDKTTLVYNGLISASTGTFQPTITLRAASNATAPSDDTVSIVADSFQFVRNGTNATLVSILEYSPQNYSQAIQPAWRPLAQQLPAGATVRSIDPSAAQTLYIAGDFSSPNNTYRSIISYNYQAGRLEPLHDIGVNGTVAAVAVSGNSLYVGGTFNSTAAGSTEALNNVARYDLSTGAWARLMQGVNGPVGNIVLENNATITFSGNFSSMVPDTAAAGNAVWDTVSQRWTDRKAFVAGSIVSVSSLNASSTAWAGQIRAAQTYRADAAATMDTQQAWTPYLFDSEAIVNTGVFWHNTTGGGNRTVMIVGGRFQTLSNLAMYQDGTWKSIGNLQGDIRALAIIHDVLYIGGVFNGSLGNSQPKNFAAYDLNTQSVQDTAGVYGINGAPGTVSVIRPQPDGQALYVGGDFENAGSLSCAAVCKLDTNTRQWNQVSTGTRVSGQVADMVVTNSQVVVVGNLTVDGAQTHAASMQTSDTTWKVMSDTSPTTAVLDGPNNQAILAGNNGTLGTWDGQTFTSLNSHLGSDSTIRQMLFMPITSSPSNARYPPDSESMLLAVGHLHLPDNRNASAALFDGSTWYPYVLSSQKDGASGQLQQVFHEANCCTASTIIHHLPVPAVILISIAISLGIIFLLVGAGLMALFWKRRNGPPDSPEPMPPYMSERGNGLASMLDTAQAGTMGAGAAAAIAGASAPSSSGPHASTAAADTNEATGTTGAVQNAGAADAGAVGTGTGFAALMAAAAAARHDEPISEDNPRLFHARYPFEAKEHGELDLQAGDHVVVTDVSDNVWWMGYIDDGKGNPVWGLFPSNYVAEPQR